MTHSKKIQNSQEQVFDAFFTETSDPNDSRSQVPFDLPQNATIPNDNSNIKPPNSIDTALRSMSTDPENEPQTNDDENVDADNRPTTLPGCVFGDANNAAMNSALGEINQEIDEEKNCYSSADNVRLKDSVNDPIFWIKKWGTLVIPGEFGRSEPSFIACGVDNVSKINAKKDEALSILQGMKSGLCCSANGAATNKEAIERIRFQRWSEFKEKWEDRLTNTQCANPSGQTNHIGAADIDSFFGSVNDALHIVPNFKDLGICPKTPLEIEPALQRWMDDILKGLDAKAIELVSNAAGRGGFFGPSGLFSKLTNKFLQEKYNFSSADIEHINSKITGLFDVAIGIAEVISNLLFPQSLIAKAISGADLILSGLGALEDLADALGVNNAAELKSMSAEQLVQTFIRFTTSKFFQSDVSPYGNFAIKEIINNYLSNEIELLHSQFIHGNISCNELLDRFEQAVETAMESALELFEVFFARWYNEQIAQVIANSDAANTAAGPGRGDGDLRQTDPRESETLRKLLDDLADNAGQLNNLFGFEGTELRIGTCDNLFNPFENTHIRLNDYIDGILSMFNLSPLPEIIKETCLPGSDDPFGPQATESLPLSHLPIAHESADCIGEQCEVGSRLRYRVRVIQPGRSLNNYHYAPEMLESSAALLEGVPVQAYGYGQYQPMFSHLPQDVEPVQPSGFALNRVGVLTDAAYESHDQFGEGLFATLIVDKAAEGWARSILDEATTPGGNGTGVSIFADIDGDYEYDPVHDDLFVRVDAIKHFRSVDLASSPAAGGAIVSALEDACVNERTRMASLLWWIKNLPAEEIMEARNWRTW